MPKPVKKMEQETIKFLNKTFTLAAILVVGILVFFVGQIFFQQKTLDQMNNYQITVSGEGKVYAKPDIATVTLGAKTDGVNIQNITQENITVMNKIIEDLKNLGIEDKDIQTTQYSVYPKYNWTEREGSIPDGYTIEQNIKVKIRDFDKISNVLSIASSRGANVVSGLQFTIDNPEQLRQEARAKAIAQAKISAEKLAKDSGINLGKLINVYENYNAYPMMYDKAVGLGGAVPESAPVPTIQSGQQEINVTVNLTYQVR